MTITRVKKKKSKTIHDLDQEKFDIIESLLIKNTSAPKLVQKIQVEWGLLVDVKPETLQKQLVRYKKDKITPHLHAHVKVPEVIQVKPKGEPIGEELTVKTTVIFARPDKRIDAHEALTELVEVQMIRLQKIYNREDATPMLMETVRQNIHTMSGLLKQLSDLQFDLGVAKRVSPIQKHLIGTFDLTESEIQQVHAQSKTENDELAIATQKVIELFKTDVKLIEDKSTDES